MTTTTAGTSLGEVEAAVASVLLEMRIGRRSGANGRPESAERGGESDAFAGPLLSLREAEKLALNSERVRVAPGTVVTPLARDYLKSRGVEIRLVARDEAGRSAAAGEWGFSTGTGTASGVGAGVTEAFRRVLLGSPDAWRELAPSPDEAALWVAGGSCRGALVMTDEPSAAVYMGCQVGGVRAASADDAGAVARAVRGLGVNLLVVEPAGKSIATLKQMAATFRRAGGPRAPDWIGLARERIAR